MRNNITFSLLIFLFVACTSARKTTPQSISGVMDQVISRLYSEISPTAFHRIDDAFLLDFLSLAEREVLSSSYQYFTVNVPVTVSLMRDRDQQVLPFWLEDAGFVKTSMVVKNEVSAYEVWQKNFEPGIVTLGINGFDKHRPVYFVAVGARDPQDSLVITDYYPAQYPMDTLAVGSFTYHDWSDLLLTEVPPSLVGQAYFTTVRGRAREAHIVGAFRKTPFPSGDFPDQIMLNWSGNPQTTLDIQWRTNTAVETGEVQYWEPGTTDTLSVAAAPYVIQDRLLYNDRYVHRFTAQLDALKPETTYSYRVGSAISGKWSEPQTFTTEGPGQTAFSFVWFGDTHCFPDSGRLITLAEQRNPDASFYSIAGDIVSTGLYRDDWDKFFHYAGGAFSRKPLMPVLGNHDRQDGLGAQLYYDLFSLPENGPENVEKESSYFFEYGNALFVMIDATSEVADHTPWLEQVLANTTATWKFVMFHFPPYNFEEPYEDIQQAWVPLFDQYHVDMVMGGHIHYYMRSRPMAGGKVVDSPADGTVYAISISIPSEHDNVVPEPYAVVQFKSGYFYQRMQIDGNTLHYTAVDSHGKVVDGFTIKK